MTWHVHDLVYHDLYQCIMICTNVPLLVPMYHDLACIRLGAECLVPMYHDLYQLPWYVLMYHLLYQYYMTWHVPGLLYNVPWPSTYIVHPCTMKVMDFKVNMNTSNYGPWYVKWNVKCTWRNVKCMPVTPGAALSLLPSGAEIQIAFINYFHSTIPITRNALYPVLIAYDWQIQHWTPNFYHKIG